MMKKKVLFLCVITYSFVFNYAQNAKVVSAYNYLRYYNKDKKCNDLKKAMDNINLAINHDKTKDSPKTWFYRAKIYHAIYESKDEACKTLNKEALNEAFKSYMKTIKLDTRKEYIPQVIPLLAVAGQEFLNYGVNFYNKKQFEKALDAFEKAILINGKFLQKIDTLALFNAAITAEKLGKTTTTDTMKNNYYKKAIMYYQALIQTKYGGEEKVASYYLFISHIYNDMGDSTKAFETIKTGRKEYPKNYKLIIEELNYYLSSGKQDKAISLIDTAIKKDPSNKVLYYNKGVILDKLGKTESAELAYKKAITLDSSYYDAIYNLGAMYFNIGVKYVEEANNYDFNEQEKIQEAQNKANKYFKTALPYLEKAEKLNPTDRNTLISLQQLYARMGNNEGYKRVKELLNTLINVKYILDCSNCNVTYYNKNGGIEQKSNVDSNWSYSFKGKPGQFVSLTAQNNKSDGTVTVIIYLDNVIFKKATSSGGYVIATASGTIPKN